MRIYIFGMSFGTIEIVLGAFIAVIIVMYFMQKSR